MLRSLEVRLCISLYRCLHLGGGLYFSDIGLAVKFEFGSLTSDSGCLLCIRTPFISGHDIQSMV